MDWKPIETLKPTAEDEWIVVLVRAAGAGYTEAPFLPMTWRSDEAGWFDGYHFHGHDLTERFSHWAVIDVKAG